MIKYYHSSEIDKKMWDKCIKRASNHHVYAFSEYLDCLCDSWDALILNDYEAVMPLPNRSKYGLKYIYQPFFVQQLGIFSSSEISKEVISKFIRAIPFFFLKIDLQLNYGNEFQTEHKRTNYILDLQSDYESIKIKYHSNLKRNIDRSEKANLVVEQIEPMYAFQIFKKNMGERLNELGEKDYKRLEKFLISDSTHLKTEAYGVFGIKNQVAAVGLFIKSEKRMVYLLGTTTEDGKKVGAGHFLFDYVIKNHANKDLILDFEGSEIPSVANFYQQFSPQNQPYFPLRIKRLKFWKR